MRTNEILKKMKDEKKFLGVFSADNLPKQPVIGGLIVNTDKSDQPGSHWVAFYATNKRECEYFDPFGNPPLVNDLILFSKKYSMCEFSSRQIQDINTTICGQLCIAYLKSRFKGLTMLEILSSI